MGTIHSNRKLYVAGVMAIVLILPASFLSFSSSCPEVKQTKTRTTMNYSKDAGALSSPTMHQADNKDDIVYHFQPLHFVSSLADCILDNLNTTSNKTCHIMYQHVGKTGGTSVEQFFWGLFGLEQLSGCCDERVMNRFYKNTRDSCQRPFQSFQLDWVGGLDGLVKTCHDQFYKRAPHNNRVIVLTTLREPVERTLSAIHQLCNKNWTKRDKRTRAACRACHYDNYTDIWLGKVNQTNLMYTRIQNESTTHSFQGFPHYWVDLADLSAMTRGLWQHISPIFPHLDHVFEASLAHKSNPEDLHVCSFQVNSPMFRALKPAKDAYRAFSTGTLWKP